MTLDEFMYVISNLNNGNVISDTSNDDAEIILGVSDLKLYTTNNKYYFIAEYHNNYDVIESNIKDNPILKEINDLRPNNCYLILLYEIDKLDDQTSKKIIRLEENEFFYKKYICYYTKEEYTNFKNWFDKLSEKSISNILKYEECSPDSEELYIQFLLRLAIKVPFLKIEFKKMELENFEDLLDYQLEGIRQKKEEVKKMYSQLAHEFENYSIDTIAERLVSEIIGGNDED